jgi:hypothetical protein
MICPSVNFDFFMQNLLFEKILLPRPANSRGDYPAMRAWLSVGAGNDESLPGFHDSGNGGAARGSGGPDGDRDGAVLS